MENKINWLSASKIKTLNACSQLYFGRYHEKLPDKGNLGSRLGGLVHSILETLLNKPKYSKLVAKINKNGKLSKGLIRLIRAKLTKEGINTPENIEKLKSFALVGLANDFFLEGGELQKPETAFEISQDGYNIRGFIDKYALFFDGQDWYAKIVDMKSSKQRFSEKELDGSIQALSYLLAVKNLHPQISIEKSKVQFLFLQYPDNPIQEVTLKEENIAGVKEYLRYLQGYSDRFSEKDAVSNLAANQDYPKEGEGFCGKLLCGYGKYPGHLKKDGKPYFYCGLKFAFPYYALLDKDGSVIKTAFEEKDLKASDEQKIELRQYLGCPSHNDTGQNSAANDVDFF